MSLVHTNIDSLFLSGKFGRLVFSQKVYSGSASHQCRQVGQSEASRVILCRPITTEKTCTAELSFLFTFCQPAIVETNFFLNILFFHQLRYNSHLLWQRKDAFISYQFFRTLIAWGFFHLLRLLCIGRWPADPKPTCLPPILLPLFCHFAVKVENRGGRSPTTPRDD